jgi:hypothetical protein
MPSFRLLSLEHTILLSQKQAFSVAQNHHDVGNSCRRLRFALTVQSRALLVEGPRGVFMWADIVGVLVVLSIAILIAHAFDAFRSD